MTIAICSACGGGGGETPAPDAAAPPDALPPGLIVHPASVAEGQSGVVRMTVAVTISPGPDAPVEVDFEASAGTATVGSDFVATAGTLTFAAGETEQTVTVEVLGDLDAEATETFAVTLSNPVGAPIAVDQAPCEIRNDDSAVTTSYELQRQGLAIDHVALRAGRPSPSNFVLAYCDADFDTDGFVDTVIASGDGTANPTPIDYFRNDGTGTFLYDPTRLPASAPGQVHPRKCVGGDFDGDQRADAFFAGHGYDQPPFPGEVPVLLLGGATAFTVGALPAGIEGFDHGAASGDVDEDGDLDIVIVRNSGGVLLINDGDAGFTVDVAAMPASLQAGAAMFTGELIDIDVDGHLDLWISGHEQDGLRATIFWGDGSGTFRDNRRTELPEVTGWGVTIDLDAEDLDADGLRDLVLDRTGDGTTGIAFYQGYMVQVLRQTEARAFEDVTASAAPSAISTLDGWLVWLRLRDVDADGDVDLQVEDASRALIWANDGTGALAPPIAP